MENLSGSTKQSHSKKRTDAKKDPTDRYFDLWKPLPGRAKVFRVQGAYEFRILLTPGEAPTVIYSAMSAVEHLKETALFPGGPEADPRFAQALPQLAYESREKMAFEQGFRAARKREEARRRELSVQQKAPRVAGTLKSVRAPKKLKSAEKKLNEQELKA